MTWTIVIIAVVIILVVLMAISGVDPSDIGDMFGGD